MNGALNNASMAMEVAVGDTSQDPNSAEVLRAGLAAIGQASRAAALLAHLVNRRGVPGDADLAYVRDVRDILRQHAWSRGRDLSPALDPADGDAPTDAAQAADLLVREIARVHPDGNRGA